MTSSHLDIEYLNISFHSILDGHPDDYTTAISLNMCHVPTGDSMDLGKHWIDGNIEGGVERETVDWMEEVRLIPNMCYPYYKLIN